MSSSGYTPQSAKVDPSLPAGSWDTHFHIFPPGAPLGAGGPFVPTRIPLAEQERFHRELGTLNGVCAHSFAFEMDQSTLADWLAAAPVVAEKGIRRALAVITPETSAEAIKKLHAEGVRGIRCGTPSKDAEGKAEDVRLMLSKLDEAGVEWSVAVQDPACPRIWDVLLAVIDRSPQSQVLMIDHLGFLPGPWSESPPRYVSQAEVEKLPHVDSVLGLLKRNNVYIKLSAPYRITSEYVSLENLVKAIAKAAPERIVWASDWPYVPTPEQLAAHKKEKGTEAEITFRTEDTPRWIGLLKKWLGEELFNRMMVENAARLYAN